MSGRKIIAYSSPSGAPLTGRTLELRPVGATIPLVHPFHIANGLYDTGLIAEGLYRLWDITTTPTDTGLYVDVGADTLKENIIPNGSGNHALFGNKEFRRIQIADVEDLATEVDEINEDISDLQGEITSAKARLTAVELEADVIPSKFDKAGGTISGFTGLGTGSTPIKMKTYQVQLSVTAGAGTQIPVTECSVEDIIAIFALVAEASENYLHPPSSKSGFEYNLVAYKVDGATGIQITTTHSNSAGILGKFATVTILYKE